MLNENTPLAEDAKFIAEQLSQKMLPAVTRQFAVLPLIAAEEQRALNAGKQIG